MERRDRAVRQVQPEDRATAVRRVESKTVAAGAAAERRPVQVAIAALDECAVRRRSVGAAAEHMNRRERAVCRVEAEDGAVSGKCRGGEAVGAAAAANRGAVEEAVGGLYQRRVRAAAVGAARERVQRKERAGVLRRRDGIEPKDGSRTRPGAVEGPAAADRRPVEQSVARLGDARNRACAIGYRMDEGNDDVIQLVQPDELRRLGKRRVLGDRQRGDN